MKHFILFICFSFLSHTALALDDNHIPVTDVVPKATIALVGGTFVNDEIFNRDLIKSKFTIPTDVGTSPTIYYAEYKNTPFYYVHSHGHDWLPTWAALYDLGVKDVIGGATAGAINTEMNVYDYVVADDFIDLNVDRALRIPNKVYHDPDNIVIPRYMPPMDKDLQEILLTHTKKALKDKPWQVHDKGVIVQTKGGRFETAAEVKMMEIMGGDLVTMSVGTEIIYARMLGINYACLIVISNPAEGVAPWDFSMMKELYPKINPVSLNIVLDSLADIAAIGDKPRSLDGQVFHPEMTSKEQ